MSIYSLVHLPIHKHGLVLQEFSKTCRLVCMICHLPVSSSPAYQCLDCEDIFLVHKSCAQPAPHIQHPSHRDHPLCLSEMIDLHSGYTCAGCSQIVCGIGYQCEVCRVYMHVNCAVATLPPTEDEHQPKPQEEVIQHFAHEHPLAFFHMNASNNIKCKACHANIKGPVYACRGCFYILHESCALLPTKMPKHPFHPQHSLAMPTSFMKYGSLDDPFIYRCEECDFSIDFRSIVSVLRHPVDNHNDEVPDRPSRHHFSHPHLLTCLHTNIELFIKCKLCKESISGHFCCCPDCLFMVHESCAELSEEIMHPLHPHHPLIYQASIESSLFSFCLFCGHACSSMSEFDPIFYCSDCKFFMHVGCVVQSLSVLRSGVAPIIQDLHWHPMRLFRLDSSICAICGSSLYGLAYLCEDEDCDFIIHIECAKALRVLQQPFHPTHPLVLSYEPTRESAPCNGCLKLCDGRIYSCDSCKFQLHLACAFPELTTKHPRHEHELSYFKKTKKLVCSLCYGDCRNDIYRCVPCNYNLHYSCLDLPKSVEHELHIHPMELRDRVVVEHLGLDDQYCDLCETLRNPDHGVYYCDKCYCAAHIDCVIPKDERQKLGDANVLQKIDEEIASSDEQIKVLKAELEKLEENLETSTKEQERIKNKRRETSSLIMQAERVELDINRGMNSSSRLQLPVHKHELVLFREMSKHFSLNCNICRLPLKGKPYYQCRDCKDMFVIHKSCAEAAPLIQHPSHLEHPLVIREVGRYKECYGCESYLSSSGYGCEVCDVWLHVGCATATLLPRKEEHQLKEKVTHHFAHEHPLVSFHVNVWNDIKCKACRGKISGHVYGCRGCLFMLHEPCALLSTETLKHPFHPEHPLYLLTDFLRCQACRTQDEFFAYQCHECDFNLDVDCATSVVYNEAGVQTHHHFSHPHQLISLHATSELHVKCKLCRGKISGSFYCCTGCLFMLHESCVESSQDTVHHPSHPDHPLTYQSKPDESKTVTGCQFCQESKPIARSDPMFHCAECSFSADMVCTIQSLSALRSGAASTIHNLHLHPHPMSISRRFSLCWACFLPIDGIGYHCPDCSYASFHIECADIPGELQHSFHPQHPLILHQQPLRGSAPCDACLRPFYDRSCFAFGCDSCKFQVHVDCALKHPSLKHPRHEHDLTYFDKIEHLVCNLCYEDCSIDLFRCVPCNYNLHYTCMDLPPSVEHKLHIHPMVLRDRVVVEHLSLDDQYCDLCETLRHPDHGVYYCDQCYCAAHIDCVIPKDERWKLQEALNFRKLDEEETANADMMCEELKAKTEELKKKLEESRKELERLKHQKWEITSSRMQGEA